VKITGPEKAAYEAWTVPRTMAVDFAIKSFIESCCRVAD
jgi:hypothetical protein